MRKKIITTTLISSTMLLMAADTPVQQANRETMMEGVKYIKMLGKALKQNVGKRLKEDPTGVLAAEFCSASASKVAQEVSAGFPDHIKVRRTALKYRNEGNKPDATDIKTMEGIEAAMKAGTFDKKPVMVKMDDNTTRIYAPVMTEKACLKCHGDQKNIDPKVQKIITDKYPKDQAIGFKEGELRGVAIAEITPKKAPAKKETNSTK